MGIIAPSRASLILEAWITSKEGRYLRQPRPQEGGLANGGGLARIGGAGRDVASAPDMEVGR